MAVEKMQMLNLVGQISNLDRILKDLVLVGDIHPIDAYKEIDDSNFTLNMVEENLEEIVNMCSIEPFLSNLDFRDVHAKLGNLMSKLGIEKKIDYSYYNHDFDFTYIENNVNVINQKFSDLNESIEELLKEHEDIIDMNIVESFEKLDVNLKDIYEMNHFYFKIGTLTKENRERLALNYENVSAAVMHISSYNGNEVYLVISPKGLRLETERILKSVFFEEVKLMEEYLDYPAKMITRMNLRLIEINNELAELRYEVDSFKDKFHEMIRESYSQISLEEVIHDLKSKIACTRSFFYFSAWTPESNKAKIDDKFSTYDESLIITYKEVDDEITKTLTPPTKLKNHKILKPFELLVNMYGIPSYTEIDPTMFLGIAYMLLFGAMFGDVGQGLVIALGGLLLQSKSDDGLAGGILVRLGSSSMLFGFFYDSIFGYEHVISSLVGNLLGHGLSDVIFIRPIENINLILYSSILVGIFLLVISFTLSIMNKLKAKNIKEGIFGRNGIAGLLLYVSILLIVVGNLYGLPQIMIRLLVATAIIMVGCIVFREPLSNILRNIKPLHHESLSEYYVESGFDVIETFLSMLSNSVSFIRVGAFALNHVGLFIAFHTMAEIIGTTTGSIITAIVGNVIVIALEGLIVFIQGLRLVYYEMFSKYYTGDGVAFKPISIKSRV